MVESKKRLKTLIILSRFVRTDLGFSIAELMVVVAIIGIAAAIAIPNFISWLPNYRLQAATQDMYSNLQLAKSTAVQRSMNCTVVFNQTINGVQNAYAVFLDADGDFNYDAGEEVILQQRMESYPDVNFDVTQGGGDGVSFPDNSDGNPAISFRSTGVPVASGGLVANGSVFFINTNGRSMSVVANISGSLSVNRL